MNSQLVRQGDFSGGEVAPLSYGRTESPAYKTGLRLALNLIPTAEGQLLNRPGTRFSVATKNQAQPDLITSTPRLMRFAFADGQRFVLEVGDFYIRFVQAGVQLGAPYELPTVWAIADVMRLKFSQNGDIITVTHPSYAPQEIARISNLNWTVTMQSYVPQAYFAGAPTIPWDGIGRGEGILAWDVNTSYNQGDLANYNGEIMLALLPSTGRWPDNNKGTTPYWTDTSPLPAFGIGAPVSAAAPYVPATTYPAGSFVYYRTPRGSANPYNLFIALQTAVPGHTPASLAGLAQALDTVWANVTWSFFKNYKKGAYVWYSTDIGSADSGLYVSLQDNNAGITPGTQPLQWALAADVAHPSKQWQEVITQVYSDSLGVIRETLGSAPTQPLSYSLYTDRPGQFSWGTEIGDNGPASWVILGYNVYRGRNGIFGFVGTTPAGTRTFNDDGASPDFSQQPPRGTHPFDIATGRAAKTQSYPGAFTYHEQRAIYARSDKRPQDFWGSAVAKLKTFDVNTPVQQTDTFNFRLGSERLEEIRSMLSLRQLLLFTGAGEWAAAGFSGPITPNSIFLKRSSRYGSGYLDPLAIEQSALFVTARGRVRDLVYDFRSDTYRGRDVSVIARHLFEGHQIVDWAFAETPYNIIWAVREDGALLSLTYNSDGIEAWAQHTTAGRFERVCCIIETDPVTGVSEDAVYVIVRRVVGGVPKRYIERFSTRVIPLLQTTAADGQITSVQDVRLGNFLDAGVQFDGRNVSATLMSLGTGGDLVVGSQQNVAAVSMFVAGDVGSSIVITDAAGNDYLFKIVAFVDVSHVTVEVQTPVAAAVSALWLFPAGTTTWAFARPTVGGLAHLNGLQVNALVDGGVQGPFTVVGGAITLTTAGVIVQAGLPYTSDLDLLDIAADTAKTNVKSVRKATFEVVSSRGLQAGETLDGKLYEPMAQRVSDSRVADGSALPPLVTGNVEVVIASSWNEQGGRACLRHTDPLPLTVVAVVREIVIGGR